MSNNTIKSVPAIADGVLEQQKAALAPFIKMAAVPNNNEFQLLAGAITQQAMLRLLQSPVNIFDPNFLYGLQQLETEETTLPLVSSMMSSGNACAGLFALNHMVTKLDMPWLYLLSKGQTPATHAWNLLYWAGKTSKKAVDTLQTLLPRIHRLLEPSVAEQLGFPHGHTEMTVDQDTIIALAAMGSWASMVTGEPAGFDTPEGLQLWLEDLVSM